MISRLQEWEDSSSMEDNAGLSPLFDFDSNENSVLLHSGVANLCIKDTNYIGEGEARLELLPKANIVFYAELANVDIHYDLDDVRSFTLDTQAINGFSIGSSFDPNSQRTKIKWIAKSESIKLNLLPNEETKNIVFHLFNFDDFNGAGSSLQTEGNVRKRISHFTLSWKAYQITVQSVFSVKDNITTLKNEGGYRLTQVGKIEKSDNSSFQDDEVKNLLDALRYFISFAKGSWCSPVCSIGLDNDGNKTWHSLNSPDKQWESLSAWFDIKHAAELENLFPMFMELWEHERWKDTISEVVYWYLNSNNPSRGVDAGLILAQAALERLSYEYVVNEKKLLTVKAFKNSRGSDKLRLLFSSLSIPLEISSLCTNISISSSRHNWIDAPHALAEIRNALVHPENKKYGQISTELFIEAWDLSLWYIEMVILAISGYSGKYANRLISGRYIGQVDNIPWGTL